MTPKGPIVPRSLSDAIAVTTANPLDIAAHEALGDVWRKSSQPIAAGACYRTTMALGGAQPQVMLKLAISELEAGRPIEASRRLGSLVGNIDGELGTQINKAHDLCSSVSEIPLTDFDHNRHYRMVALATYLTKIAGRADFELLDVGGGDGLLALHLPDVGYRLAEPGTNGLRGEQLPFPDQSVDVVCACHVLEHVPPEARFDFLDALKARAREHLVLLNPFRVEGSHYDERLRTVIDITGAEWAKEHLECGLPELSLVEEYAASRGLTLHVEPNGATPTAFLANFVNHYAHLAGRSEELPRIHRYLNSLDSESLTNPQLPAASLVHFSWAE